MSTSSFRSRRHACGPATCLAAVTVVHHGYQPAFTLSLHGDDRQPARMRFTIAVTIQGQVLGEAHLRAAIIEAQQRDFNVTEVAVSNGQAVAGTPT